MNLIKKYVFVFNMIFGLLLSVYVVNSACNYSPDYLEMSSGSMNLGIFHNGDNVYIRPNLQTYPVKFTIVFNNTQNDCFVSNNDVSVQLFPSGGQIPVDAIKTTAYDNNSYFLSRAIVTFNPSTIITTPVKSTYYVKGVDTGFLMLYADNQSPLINLVVQPSKAIYKKNDTINVGYQVTDTGSGLSSVVVSGPVNKVLNFEGNSTFSGSLSFNLTSSQTLTFTAQDKLNQQSAVNVSFFVDNTPPLITSLDKVYSFNGVRYVSFSTIVSDDSFSHTSQTPVVSADFSKVNPSYSNSLAQCSVTTNSTYKCTWSDIPITLAQTETVNIPVNVSDSVGNSKAYSFNEEIFVDKQGPQIEDFYLENSLGIKNIFSSYDNSTKIYLRFKDDSLADPLAQVKIYENFDKMTLEVPNCQVNGNERICVWNLGNSVKLYQGLASAKIPLQVTLVDMYGNPSVGKINVTLDNTPPKIENIKLIETANIKDGIVNSGEKIGFKVFIGGNNLDNNGKYSVFGKFSTIDKNILNDVAGACQKYNESVVECDFNNIIAKNGYAKENVTFYVNNSAGNMDVVNYPVEILKIGTEVPDAFRIIDLNSNNPSNKAGNLYILNPIARDQIHEGSVTAWFRGKLTEINPSENFRLVNYALKGCQKIKNSSIFSTNIQLYPSSPMTYKKEGDENFAIKVDLHDAPNYNDLNDFEMNCELSVLKRDNQTIYGTNYDNGELINFTLKFSFYDAPRGDLLKANAAKILEMANDAQSTSKLLDQVNSIFTMASTLCNTLNTADDVFATVSNAWTYTKIVLDETPASGVAAAVSNIVYPGQGMVSNYVFGSPKSPSMFKKMCDWVTCRNSAILGGGSSDLTGGLYSKLSNNFQNSCTSIADSFNKKTGGK